MRAFIQCNKHFDLITESEKLEPINPNVFNAFYGLRDMGFECIFFETYDDLIDFRHSRSEIICGGLGTIKRRLEDFGISTDEINYPEELKKCLHRDIWTSTMNAVANSPDSWPVFVKSVEGKKLTGKVISNIGDLVGCGYCDEDYPVICSNQLKIISEYRVFVRYGKVLDMKHYSGDWSVVPDTTVIKNAIEDYTTCPDSYGIDFGITDSGETVLIEVNDAYAIGCYGLQAHYYAKFLLTRWAQLTDTPDEYFYI